MHPFVQGGADMSREGKTGLWFLEAILQTSLLSFLETKF
jgi:hypothetical protein